MVTNTKLVTDAQLQQEWKYISWETENCPVPEYNKDEEERFAVINELRNVVNAQKRRFEEISSEGNLKGASDVKQRQAKELEAQHFKFYIEQLGNYYRKNGMIPTYLNQMPKMLGENALGDYNAAVKDAFERI